MHFAVLSLRVAVVVVVAVAVEAAVVVGAAVATVTDVAAVAVDSMWTACESGSKFDCYNDHRLDSQIHMVHRCRATMKLAAMLANVIEFGR